MRRSLAEQASGRRLTPAEVSSYWTGRTLRYIAAQPGDWLRLLARKTRLLVSGTEIIDTESQESHAEYSWPLACSGGSGISACCCRSRRSARLRCGHRRRAVAVVRAHRGYAASVVLFFVVARYRLPLVPMLIIFAAGGVLAIAGRRRPQRERREAARASTAWAIALALAIASNWPLYSAASQQAITENNLGTALAGEPGGRRSDRATTSARSLFEARLHAGDEQPWHRAPRRRSRG